MATYIFILHNQGEDAQRVEAEFAEDIVALSTADELSSFCDVDVWHNDRVLTILQRRDAVHVAA